MKPESIIRLFSTLQKRMREYAGIPDGSVHHDLLKLAAEILDESEELCDGKEQLSDGRSVLADPQLCRRLGGALTIADSIFRVLDLKDETAARMSLEIYRDQWADVRNWE